MSNITVDQHSIASFRKFYKLLPRGADASLLILKLHLLVEEQVRAFVDERVSKPESLLEAKLECHQAICLAEALSSEEIHPNIWEAARKLNTLRNLIAHSLEPKGIIDRMEAISSLIGAPRSPHAVDSKARQTAAVERLSFAVSLLHSGISIYVKRKPANVLSIVPPKSDA